MSRLPSRRPKFMGAKLKQIRECRHPSLTQEEFASLVKQYLSKDCTHEYPELNREYISGYDRGTRTVPPIILLVYAQLANVYVEVIMDDRLYLMSIRYSRSTPSSKGLKKVLEVSVAANLTIVDSVQAARNGRGPRGNVQK